MARLKDIVITNKDWARILKSVMPGGKNWQQSLDKNHNCMPDCPGAKRCNKDSGPDNLLCSRRWGESKVNKINLKVLKHVLENFDHYDRGDCTVKDNKKIDMLLFHICHWANLIQGNFPSRCHEEHSGLKAPETPKATASLTQMAIKKVVGIGIL